MPERIFVTGGSGFVGSAVIDRLVERGFEVSALANRGDVPSRGGMVSTVRGGLFDPAALDEGLRGCSAAIHLVGIIMEEPSKGITFERIHFEGTRNVVEAAKRCGVRRYVQMSALGTRADAASRCHRTKYVAEQAVRESGLDWTIIRPSMIHGPGGEFMKMEAAWANGSAAPFLFMPYFGAGVLGFGGAGKLQPVYVNDVARAFVDALDKPETVGQAYGIGGPEEMTWPQMHRQAAEIIRGKRRAVLAIPAWYAKVLAAVVPRSLLPFNRDQVLMSQEDNTCDLGPFRTTFGWEPQGFAESLRSYASRL